MRMKMQNMIMQDTKMSNTEMKVKLISCDDSGLATSLGDLNIITNLLCLLHCVERYFDSASKIIELTGWGVRCIGERRLTAVGMVGGSIVYHRVSQEQ